jgi:hypothetical protein
VNTENGSIAIGDLLSPSSIPGVAMKATETRFVVGVAGASYEGDGIGMILSYIGQFSDHQSRNVTATSAVQKILSGIATIPIGETSTRISFTDMSVYPMIYVLPINGGTNWNITEVTSSSFLLSTPAPSTSDTVFSWRVTPSSAETMEWRSDNTSLLIDPTSGLPVMGTEESADEGASSSDEASLDEDAEETLSDGEVASDEQPPLAEEPPAFVSSTEEGYVPSEEQVTP